MRLSDCIFSLRWLADSPQPVWVLGFSQLTLPPPLRRLSFWLWVSVQCCMRFWYAFPVGAVYWQGRGVGPRPTHPPLWRPNTHQEGTLYWEREEIRMKIYPHKQILLFIKTIHLFPIFSFESLHRVIKCSVTYWPVYVVITEWSRLLEWWRTNKASYMMCGLAIMLIISKTY